MLNLSELELLIGNTKGMGWIAKLLKMSSENEYYSFVMPKINFVDDFSFRLELNQEMGIVIKGLAETVDAIKNTEIDEVLVHSLSLKVKPRNIDFLIYTDVGMRRVIGIIETSDVLFNRH